MTTERDVSTSDDRIRRWLLSPDFVRLAVYCVIGALVIGTIAYFGIRLRATYTVRTELELLKAEHEDLIKNTERRDLELAARLDEIERILFGDVLAKLDKAAKAPPKVPPIALWQRNRDRQLRDRLDALETWRLQMEHKK